MLNVVTLRGLVGQPRNFIHFQVNNIFSKDFSKKKKNKNGNGFILSKSTIIISFFLAFFRTYNVHCCETVVRDLHNMNLQCNSCYLNLSYWESCQWNSKPGFFYL